MSQAYAPHHPGLILQEEFLSPSKITYRQLAEAIGIPPMWIYNLCHGEQDVTPEIALKLARYFGNSPSFWMNLQLNWMAKQMEPELLRIEPIQLREVRQKLLDNQDDVVDAIEITDET